MLPVTPLVRLALLSVLAAAAAPPSALAQAKPAQPPPDAPSPTPSPTPPGGNATTEDASKRDIEIARRYYNEAKAAHERGDYTLAAGSYEKAYKLYPKPAFLFNAAQVYRLSGDNDKALANYKRYLTLEPDGDGSERAKEFIPKLEAAILKERAEAINRPPDKVVPDPGKGDGNVVGDGEKDKLIVIDDSSKAGSGKRYAGVAVMAVGVAAIGLGTGFAFVARKRADEASDYEGPFGPELEDLYSRGEASERNAIIAAGAGGIALVVGGLLYYLGARDSSRAEHDQQWFAAPAITPDGGSLTLGARF